MYTHVYMYVWLCTILDHEVHTINGEPVRVLKFESEQIENNQNL